VVEGGRSGGT